MRKILSLLLLIAVSLSACKNSVNNSACGTQVCTALFASLGVVAVKGTDSIVMVKDVKVINKRTNKAITVPSTPPAIDYAPNFILIATDEIKDQFSTTGDDVEITATNTVTNQTKTITIKISGGCNCHIEKISGPDKIVFD